MHTLLFGEDVPSRLKDPDAQYQSVAHEYQVSTEFHQLDAASVGVHRVSSCNLVHIYLKINDNISRIF